MAPKLQRFINPHDCAVSRRRRATVVAWLAALCCCGGSRASNEPHDEEAGNRSVVLQADMFSVRFCDCVSGSAMSPFPNERTEQALRWYAHAVD